MKFWVFLVLFIVYFFSLTHVHSKINQIFHKLKASATVWVKPSMNKNSFVFVSLKTREEEKNETLTEEQIIEIMQEQNAVLKQEMNKSRIEIKEEMNKTAEEFGDKMNESTTIIKALIKNNHIKIKNALRKLEFQIKETSKESDDVASIILTKEISAKEKIVEQLKAEIDSLQEDIPKKILNDSEKSNCSSQTTCGDCTKKKKCGWCDMYQVCVDGDEFGPFFSTCRFYSYQTCNDNDCNNYHNCEECINNPLCGWCKDVLNNVEGCLNENKDYPVCPLAGWIQLGNKQNLCEFADRFKKSDFLNADMKMSQEELKLQVMQKRKILEKKKESLSITTKELSELRKKLKDLQNHYKNPTNHNNTIGYDDDLDEFEMETVNTNKTKNDNHSTLNGTHNDTSKKKDIEKSEDYKLEFSEKYEEIDQDFIAPS